MRSWSTEHGDVDFDTGKAVRCYQSHPPLVLGEGMKIYGGSCAHPIVTDAQVYVGFDYSIRKSPLSYPWVEGESFLYPIQDMGIPTDLPSFDKLIEWLVVQLTAKKKVHIGCVGGHGRTGLVLSVLVKTMLGEQNATAHVRKNYCVKAVESVEQIEFLYKRYGIVRVQPTKEHHAITAVPFKSHGVLKKEAGIPQYVTPPPSRKYDATAGAQRPDSKKPSFGTKLGVIWKNSPYRSE